MKENFNDSSEYKPKIMDYKEANLKQELSKFDDPNEPKPDPKLSPIENAKKVQEYDDNIMKEDLKANDERIKAVNETMEKEATKKGRASIQGAV